MGISEFKTSLVYRANSRNAKATQRNPVLKEEEKEEENKEKESFKSLLYCTGQGHSLSLHIQ